MALFVRTSALVSFLRHHFTDMDKIGRQRYVEIFECQRKDTYIQCSDVNMYSALVGCLR